MPAFPSSDFITIGSGLNVAAFYPVDYRFVFANATDRLALSWYAAYEGLVTYQQDTQELYVLINKGPEGAPTIGQNSSWRLVGGGSGNNYAAEWAFTNTNNQSFAFTGDGLPSPENDPTLYLLRGQSYRFSNNNTLGTHPFQIQTDVSTVINGGTPYNLGVTNNRASGSQQLIFDVPMSAPDTLYYQCTSHPAMSGSLIIVGNPGSGSASSGSGFPFSGSAVITGSLEVTGSITASAGVVNQLTASYAISSSISDQALASNTSSFIPFDGNRAISNLDLSVGGQNLAIYGENMNTNGLADFIDQVFFKNTGPVISTTGFTIQEYLPSSSVVGTVSATDPEGQSFTFSTASTYTDDFFRIDSNTGVVTMNVKSTSSMNTFNDAGTDKAPFPIVATDTGNLTGSKTLYIRVVPNTAPKWGITQNAGDLTQVTSSLSESSAIGNDKHRYYYRDDEDNNNTITINSGSFSPNFETDFRLVNVTGITYPYVRLDQINNVDFDTYPSYSFALTASDEHYIDGDDPNSQTILPVELKILDNLPPTVGNQNLSGVREDACVGLSSTSAGTVIATDNDGTTMTVTEFVILSAYIDGVGTNVTSSLGGTSVFDASADPFVINPSTRAVTLDSGKFLNSDQANRYVYRVTIRDNFNPISSSAEVTVFVQDAPINTLTTSTAFNIIESARTSELVKQSAAGIGGSNSTSTAANASTQNWIVNSTPDFIEATNITASSTTFQLKSDLSSSATIGGDTITIQVTASQDNFPSSIQYFEKTVDVKLLVAPSLITASINSGNNLNTNGARPGGQNLFRININDGQPVGSKYDIDHSTWVFTPNAGQNLVAHRDTTITPASSGSYYVSASANLAAGNYGFTASVQNVRGFRAGTLLGNFEILQAGSGTLTGDNPSYIIESSTGTAQIKAANDGYTGAQADLDVSYGLTGFNGAAVQSYTSSNALIAVTNTGLLSVTGDISGSYVSGNTITSTITFRDQYDNIGTGTATIEVTNDVAPTVSYNLNNSLLTQSLANSGVTIGTVTANDAQGFNVTNVTLGGADASDFNLVETTGGPAANRVFNIQPSTNLVEKTYNITVTATDSYGQETTEAQAIVIDEEPILPTVYIYGSTRGNALNPYSNFYDQILTGSSGGTVASDSPMGVWQSGSLGDATISVGSGTMYLITASQAGISGNTLNGILSNIGNSGEVAFNNPSVTKMQYIIYPTNNSRLTGLPQTTRAQFRTSGPYPVGEMVLTYYISSDDKSSVESQLNNFTLQAGTGYTGSNGTVKNDITDWTVLGNLSFGYNVGAVKFNIIPSSGSLPY